MPISPQFDILTLSTSNYKGKVVIMEKLINYQSQNVVVSYRDKVVDMGYVTGTINIQRKLTKKEEREQFKLGCMRIIDNNFDGFVKSPSGKIYQVSRNNRSAKLVKG